jgi:diacylglycerol kinase family enzyme
MQPRADAPLFIVLNVGSGKHDAAAVRRELEAELSASQRVLTFHEVKAADQLEASAKLAVAQARLSGGIVVAAGGDGTINGVAQATLGSGCFFGVLPLGTFNYFSRAHGIPSEIPAACRILTGSSAMQVQVGLVNERVFLVNASVGLYPQLLEEREHAKAQLGRSRLVALGAALCTLFTFHRRLWLDIESARGKRRVLAQTLFVGNNRLQLARIGIQEGEQVEEHKLAVVVVKPVQALAMLGLVLRAIFGRLGEAREVSSFALEQLVVRPRFGRRRLKVATDGEVEQLNGPLVFRVAAHPLSLLRPSERREDPG